MRRIILLFLILWIWPLAAEIVELQILGTSDMHGTLKSNRGGIFYLANLIKEIRRPDGLLVDCGDLIQGDYSANLTKGQLALEAFNLLNYDFFVPGNHDFEFGKKVLRQRLSEIHAEVLCANFNWSRKSGKLLKPYKIITVKGVKIAFIGLTESQVSKRILPDAEMVFSREEAALADAMAKIYPENPDVIVLLRHGGIYFRGGTLYKFMRKFPEINLIFGGHTHLVNDGERIGGAFYLQPGAYAEHVVEAGLFFDTEKRKLLKITGEVHSVAPEHRRIAPEFAGLNRRLDKLLKKSARKIDYDLSKFKSVDDLRSRLALDAMQKALPDAEVYLYTSGAADFEMPKQLTLFTLRRLFPYENILTEITISPAEFEAALAELKALKNQYHAKISLIYPAAAKKKARFKLAAADYVLSGGGNNNSLFRRALDAGTFKSSGITIFDAVLDSLEK